MRNYTVVTKKGFNLSDFDANKIPERSPGNVPTFGEYLRETEPEEWDLLINIGVKVLREDFDFLMSWMLDVPEVLDKATDLLAGGIILQYNYDYRIAGVIAANALSICTPVKQNA